MDKSLFEGKTIGDIIDDDTKILSKLREGFDVRAEKITDVWLREDGPYTVFSDFNSGFVVCFKDGEPRALFYVYDLEHVAINAKRGMVTARGHETNHEYWFDDDEYSEKHTR